VRSRPLIPPATVPPGEVDRLLHWMPILVGEAAMLPWDRTFCASMIQRARGGRFDPSAKQIRQMQRIVCVHARRLLRDDDTAPDPDLPLFREHREDETGGTGG
jgi:hypothetical protein